MKRTLLVVGLGTLLVLGLLLTFTKTQGPELSPVKGVSMRARFQSPLLTQENSHATTSEHAEYRGVTVGQLVRKAYDVPDGGIDFEWEQPSRRFDVTIEIKDAEERQLALRKALERAFRISASIERRDVHQLILTCPDGKTKLQPSKALQFQSEAGPESLSVTGGTIDDLCRCLSSVLMEPVVNESQVKGRFDRRFTYKSHADLRDQLAVLGVQPTTEKRAVDQLVVRPTP